jgi:hypothetical protein
MGPYAYSFVMWLCTSPFTVLRWICALPNTTATSFSLGLNPTMMKKKKMSKVSNPNHVSINNNKIQLGIKLTLDGGGEATQPLSQAASYLDKSCYCGPTFCNNHIYPLIQTSLSCEDSWDLLTHQELLSYPFEVCMGSLVI